MASRRRAIDCIDSSRLMGCSKEKEALSVAAGSGSTAKAIRSLTPKRPQSPTRRDVRSGPKYLERPSSPRDSTPVRNTVPSASSTSRPSVDSAAEPCRPEPQNAAFCEIAPPTVARKPDKGPPNTARKPCGCKASCSCCQVTPASTTTPPKPQNPKDMA